jgi:hypothetical protein
MPLSKGAIAGIVVGSAIAVAVVIYVTIKFATAPVATNKKYACNSTNNTCAESDTGTFNSLTDCQNSCKPADVITYNCDNTLGCTKVTGPGGTFADRPTCQSKCQQLQCDTTTGKCNAASTTYTNVDTCNASCTTSGVITYNCDGALGCTKVNGPGGTFADRPTCQSKCQQLQCDTTTGKCNAASTTYTNVDTCNASCTTSGVITYNCDGTLGCTKVTGPGGTFADKPTCQSKCQQLQCNSSTGQCNAASTTYTNVDTCNASCAPASTCSAYRAPNLPLTKGTDWSLGTFTDTMSSSYSMPLANVRVTYNDPKNGSSVSTGTRMMCYTGDWTDSGSSLFMQWASSFGISPTYSITGTPSVPFLYVPQLGTVSAISALGQKGLTFDPTKSYAQDARTLNGIPGVLIENVNTGKNYRVYMGQPPSMQASERFADNHFGYHNPSTAGNDLRNTFYWNFRERTDGLPMDKAYVSASTDLYSSYKEPTTNTCFYYQATLLSTEALSAKLWPCGPAAPTDSLYVDFTDAAPLNGQLGVISGAGFNAKGADLPNKLGPQYATVMIKPNVNVGNGVIKNVCELRTYIQWNSGVKAFTVTSTGGLISSKKWASGRYEVRAKVANKPAMVWAIWMFSAVYKLPSPMANCGSASCVACTNCADYSTCCSLCSTAAATKCGSCGGPGGAACASDSDCASGGRCVIPPNSSQCNCQQCQSNPLPLDATCSGYDCSKAVACSWDGSKNQCTGSSSCSQYTTQDSCNNSGPCQGQLSWKTSGAPVGIKTPWGAAQAPQNIYYVGTADINDPSSAGPQYQTAAAGSVDAGAVLGGLPCSSYFNAEIDIEIPSNAPFFSGITTPTPPDTIRPTGHTMNMNTYRWTNSGGTGAYENLYTEAQQQPDGSRPQFIGDGCYHTYMFEWHTGDPSKNIRPKVDYFFDGNYTGTSDAFVPDIFSRLWIVSWDSGRPNGSWNGRIGANATVWSDVTEAATTTVAPQSGNTLYSVNYVDYIRITPFNEANDKYLPDPLDQENMNQLYDASQVGVDPNTGVKLPGGSGFKPATCCALVEQPSPYDGTTTVNQCVPYAYHSPPATGIKDWTNGELYTCAAPLNGNKTAPYIKSQTLVPFFQTKTAITTADGTQGYGVVWDASSNELTPSSGPSNNICSGATVKCASDADCVSYLTSQKCPANCAAGAYCRKDNSYCHISC